MAYFIFAGDVKAASQSAQQENPFFDGAKYKIMDVFSDFYKMVNPDGTERVGSRPHEIFKLNVENAYITRSRLNKTYYDKDGNPFKVSGTFAKAIREISVVGRTSGEVASELKSKFEGKEIVAKAITHYTFEQDARTKSVRMQPHTAFDFDLVEIVPPTPAN